MIYYATMKNRHKKAKSTLPKLTIPSKKTIVLITMATVGLAVLLNLIIFVMYKNKTYPRTQLNGQSIGSLSYKDIEAQAQSIVSLPQSITLKLGDKTKEMSPALLGVSVDYPSILQNIKTNRSTIPMINFVHSNKVNSSYQINHTTAKEYLQTIAPDLETPPVSAHIALNDNKFSSIPAKAPQIIDIDNSITSVIKQLNNGKTTIDLLLSADLKAPDSTFDIDKEVSSLNNSLATIISIKYEDKLKTLTKTEIAKLYEEKDNTYVLSSARIGELVNDTSKQFNLVLGNKQQAIDQISTAIKVSKNIVVTLLPAPKKLITYTYCVSAKGVDASYLGEFRSKLQAVYADTRGWSVNGQIKFVEVASGCNYTAWLTRADLVPSFSSTICDSTWSCRVGNNVIINFDRWSGASPAWNGAGGSLDGYRTMVINHETGHWLGFSHRYCGGAGQSAPVMQQQSISLQGCAFNSWPTASEIQSLKSSKKL